jgi:hypothetical protein
MRDAISRPSFQPLKILAGSGSGSVQRDSHLQELSRSYLPEVVSSIGTLVNGMLDLADKANSKEERDSESSQKNLHLIPIASPPSFIDSSTVTNKVYPEVSSKDSGKGYSEKSAKNHQAGLAHAKASGAGAGQQYFSEWKGFLVSQALNLLVVALVFGALAIFIETRRSGNQQKTFGAPQESKGQQKTLEQANKGDTGGDGGRLPITVGMEYSEARARLIDAGWQPYFPPGVNILSCNSELRACGAGRELSEMLIEREKELRAYFREQKFFETIDCRETGTGSCIQYFSDASGNNLLVETSSGSRDPRAGGGLGAPTVLSFRLVDEVTW